MIRPIDGARRLRDRIGEPRAAGNERSQRLKSCRTGHVRRDLSSRNRDRPTVQGWRVGVRVGLTISGPMRVGSVNPPRSVAIGRGVGVRVGVVMSGRITRVGNVNPP